MRGWRRREAAKEVVGLVLSGGGSRSSFQIGALRYLYDRAGLTAQVLTGTSAGSILAAVLAQGGDHASQRAALDQLERLWREMRSDADMFTEREWFARLRRRGPEWREAFLRRERRQAPLGRTFTRVSTQARDRVRARVGVPVRAVRVLPAETTPTAWNPVGVVELVSALWEVGRAAPDLEVIVRGAEQERSMYRPGPIVDRLLDPAVFAPARVAASGVRLRVAVVALESGELRYVTEDGRLVDRDDVPLPVEPVDLAEAVRASCAIPAVFPPVPLGSEHYVDGGVREVLPAEVAVDHLGVTRCYAVVAPPPGVPLQESFAGRDMLSIVLRSTAGIMADEGLRDEVAWARAAGVTVIAPELDVHDALVIDPGLIALAMDYGYLRAAEVVQGASADEEQLTRDIVEVRRAAWALEEELFAPPPVAARPAGQDAGTDSVVEPVPVPVGGPGSGAGLDDLIALKRQLHALVLQAPPGRLPPGAESWWRRFEGHPWPVPADRPW